MRSRDKPFHIINARDNMILGFDSLERAEEHARKMNQNAIDCGHVYRYEVVATLSPDISNENRCNRILEWLRTQLNGAVKTRIRKEVGISSKNINGAIETLLKTGYIERCEILARNGGRFNGYRLTSLNPQNIGQLND